MRSAALIVQSRRQFRSMRVAMLTNSPLFGRAGATVEVQMRSCSAGSHASIRDGSVAILRVRYHVRRCNVFGRAFFVYVLRFTGVRSWTVF